MPQEFIHQEAIKLAVESAEAARAAEPILEQTRASASSPLTGFLGKEDSKEP